MVAHREQLPLSSATHHTCNRIFGRFLQRLQHRNKSGYPDSLRPWCSWSQLLPKTGATPQTSLSRTHQVTIVGEFTPKHKHWGSSPGVCTMKSRSGTYMSKLRFSIFNQKYSSDRFAFLRSCYISKIADNFQHCLGGISKQFCGSFDGDPLR